MADKYRQPSEPELQSATEVVRLIQVNVQTNANKWWNGYVLANGDFYCEYGRVQDAKSDCRHDYYDAKALKGKSASDHLRKKVKEKERKGYVEQKVTAAVGAPVKKSSQGKSVDKSSLKSLATSQIKGDSETKKLVAWLAEVNIHNITSSTNISYDVSTGSFTTPLGTLVTSDALIEARQMLSDLTPFVRNRDWNNSRYQRLLGDYLQLIPQDVGRNRGWHETFFASSNALNEQNNIIDALEAALQDAAKTPSGKKATKNDSVFNVSLDVVKNNNILDGIRKKYNKDKGNHYDVKNYDVKSAWNVEITTVREAFRKQGMPLGNIQQLWHGTKASNLLSILKGGLVIPRSSDPHVCGRMYGDGLYFSDQSTKSIRYATGAWTYGGRTDRVFMFICDVAMGKSYTPRHSTSSPPPTGYNSYFAKAGKSGVMNNEMIVPNTWQCDLTYLVEFSRH